MVCAFLRRSLFLLPIALAATPLWADGVLLHPGNLVSKRGTQSDQPLTVLAVEDQKGMNDDWHRYKEFYVGRRGYLGIFSYRLPTDTGKQDVTTLELLANYKGTTRAQQRWMWQVRNFNTGKWVLVGDNKAAVDWVWTRMVFALPGDPSDFIDDSGRLTVRYLTKTSLDDSDLDYLALRVGTRDAPTPSMPPSPPPGDAPHSTAGRPVEAARASSGRSLAAASGKLLAVALRALSIPRLRPRSSISISSMCRRRR